MNNIKIYNKEDLKRFENTWYRSNSFWFVICADGYVDYFQKNCNLNISGIIFPYIENEITKSSEEKLILQLTKNLKESDNQKLKESMKILEDYYYTDNV